MVETQDRGLALLAAARTVFARDGYHRAAVRDIAQEAGVAIGTFYLYFSSKEACLHGLLDACYRQIMTAVVAARAERQGVLKKLAASLEAAVQVFAAERDLARLVFLQAAGAGPAFEARLDQLHSDFAALLEADLAEAAASGLIPSQDGHVSALAVIGALHEVILSWLQRGRPERLEEAAPALLAFVLRGVGLSAAGLPPRGVQNSP